MLHLYFMMIAVGLVGMYFIWNQFKELDKRKANTKKYLTKDRFEQVPVEVIKSGYFINYEYPNRLPIEENVDEKYIETKTSNFIRNNKLRNLELQRDNVSIMYKYLWKGEWKKSALITPLDINNYSILKGVANVSMGYVDAKSNCCYLNIPSNQDIDIYYRSEETSMYKRIIMCASLYALVCISISVV